MRKPWHYAVAALLPLVSILIFAVAINLQNPQATGFAVLVPKPTEQINAQFSIQIAEKEFIPLSSVVQVRYGGQISSLPLKELADRQNPVPEFTVNRNPALNYVGQGIQGPITIKFSLADFAIDRQLAKQPLEITLIYNTQVISKTIANLDQND